MTRKNRPLAILLLALALLSPWASVAEARQSAFDNLWNKTDGRKKSTSSWSWGPTGWAEVREPYAEAPGGERWVRYYDKARMELTNPAADIRSPWTVTTGLLVWELVTGQVQLGDTVTVPSCAEPVCGLAQAVAGDSSPINPSPTYVDFAPLISSAWGGNRQESRVGLPVVERLARLPEESPPAPPEEPGEPVDPTAVDSTSTLLPQDEGPSTSPLPQAGEEWSRSGRGEGTVALTSTLTRIAVVQDPALAISYTDTIGVYYDDVTAQTIPSVLWKYMAQQGSDWLYLFGHPISAPYWTRALVGGVEQDVLVQLFERRALTYTPANAPAWRVEMANVGQHYYQWRYRPQGATPWQPTTPQPFRVPILTYHYISVNPVPEDTLRHGLSVTPADFAAQMSYLVNNGYTTITFDDLLAARAGTIRLPSKPVILTFDDAYVDFYTNAFPILRRHGLKSTLYVPSGKVSNRGILTWEQLYELAASPLITIGGHTRTHPELDTISSRRLYDEIVNDKAILEERLGVAVMHFCYPYGRYNDEVVGMVRAAGFLTATTTHRGAATSRESTMLLSRIGIVGDDHLQGFVEKLNYYTRDVATTPADPELDAVVEDLDGG